MAPVYKITYFPIKALAEPCRFLLKYGGIEFEDDRFTLEQWPQIKPNMPFGQVPVLTTNGKQYHQHMSIARFIAKQVKLNGKNDFEDLEIDAMVDTINDLRLEISEYSYEENEAIKETRRGPLMSVTVPYYMERLDKIAKENNGYLACKRLTWADMYFVALLDYLNFMTGTDLTAKYPNLETVKKNIVAIPAIQKWIEIRPKSDA